MRRDTEASDGEADEFMTADHDPSLGEDPDPLPKDSTAKQFKRHISEKHTYSDHMFTVHNRTGYKGERLLNDFRRAFRPHRSKAFSKPIATEWTDFHIHLGVMVREDSDLSRQ